MHIWAIADLHLSFGIEGKSMDVFGGKWIDHVQKLESAWKKNIQPEDLVLIPGDISWAMHLEQALPDLLWIHQLPGTKVMIRGNHDYWWSSPSKMKKHLPPSCHLIQNDAFTFQEVSIAGTRLWDTDEFSLDAYIEYKKNPVASTKQQEIDDKKIFERELQRLELSLKQLNPDARWRVVMTHYPPIGADLQPSKVSQLLEKYRVDVCVFGHIHNASSESLVFGERNQVRYYLTAADYLDFTPLKIHL